MCLDKTISAGVRRQNVRLVEESIYDLVPSTASKKQCMVSYSHNIVRSPSVRVESRRCVYDMSATYSPFYFVGRETSTNAICCYVQSVKIATASRELPQHQASK